jgi:phosphoheptose isomerase
VSRGVVVLDRDGTINVERHYLAEPDQVELIDGAAQGLRRLSDLGLELIVITNQSGVGRGYFTEGTLALIHDRLTALLDAEGVRLSGIYVCPHVPDDGCGCRKPRTALLERAGRERGFDPREAFVVGDKPSDIELGRRAGSTTLLVRTGYGAATAAAGDVGADYIVGDLREAARVIEGLIGAGESAGTPGKGVHGMDAKPVSVTRARAYLAESAEIKRLTGEACAEAIATAARVLVEAFQSGNKLLLCGNGGSAADCQHMAAELVSRLTKDFERPGLPAIALTTDTSFLTAYANDCGFEGIFARQVQALGRPGDVLIGISTSGNSPNVIQAVEVARERGMRSVILTGASGRLAKLADVTIAVPSDDTQHIQEAHLAVEHIVCMLVEQALFGRPTQ